MERLLRGLVQVGAHPAPEECVVNWRAFRAHEIEAVNEPDQRLVAYFEQFYGSMTYPPASTLIREYFEKLDEIDVVDRLGEIVRAQLYTRTNYVAICRGVKERQDVNRLIRLCRDVAHIAEHGRALAKPVNGKKVLRGHDDAYEYLIAQVVKSTVAAKGRVTGADAMEEMFEMSRAPRMATGITSVDGPMGGGFPSPRSVFVAGPPSAGKTSLCVFLAHRWLLAGHPTAFLAVDEDAVGVSKRIAALGGLDIEKIANGDPGEQNRALAYARRLPFFIREEETVEQVTMELVDFAKGHANRTPVLVIDSLQTVRSGLTKGMETPRARVDAVADSIRAARDRGILVLASSEVNRGFYGRSKPEEQTTAMAAGKESGRIEYLAESLIVLREADTENVVDVTVAKNRGFPRVPFRLLLDPTRMTYVEVERPDAEHERREAFARDCQAIVEVIRARAGVKNREELRACLRTTGLSMSNERLRDVMHALRDANRVEERNGVYVVVERSTADMIS